MEQYYAKSKRDRTGKCNICLQLSVLTWDHVPPKGGIELQPLEVESIAGILAKNENMHFKTVMREGVRYRTICKKCNEQLLGQTLDPVMNDFHLTVGRFLKSQLYFPEQVKIRTKPILLIKAVIGHLLASKVDLDQSPFDNRLREAFLEDHISKEINVFYWAFPYNQQRVVRDFAKGTIFGNTPNVFMLNLIKYFPIAYLVTDAQSCDDLYNLCLYKDLNSQDEIELPIRLNKMKPIDYPEAPGDYDVTLLSNSGIDSIVGRPVASKR